MEVAIIKYNAGTIYSVVHANKRLGIDPIVTDDAETIKGADCVLFPGQGEAAKTMEYLRERHLDSLIKELAQPVLGICIGMQLMCSCSEENDATCLGIFVVPVKIFVSPARELKIPHMVWDSLSDMQTPLFKGLNTGDYVYFIHSYYVPLNEHTIAQNDYILPFSAAIHKGNFYATQFHPEKSGTIGNTILQNFLDIASQS